MLLFAITSKVKVDPASHMFLRLLPSVIQMTELRGGGRSLQPTRREHISLAWKGAGNRPFVSIKTPELQKVLDDCPLGNSVDDTEHRW